MRALSQKLKPASKFYYLVINESRKQIDRKVHLVYHCQSFWSAGGGGGWGGGEGRGGDEHSQTSIIST